MASKLSRATDNRLLATLSHADRSFLHPLIECVPMALKDALITAYEPIECVIFPISGMVLAVADSKNSRVEVGLIGREGMVGLPVVLGTDISPYTYLVQGVGEGLRISTGDLLMALRDRPSVFRPMGLYAQSLLVQIAQTAYANAALSLEARLARWLLMAHDRAGSLELPLTHEFLSAMLGVQRPGITLATHALAAAGAVQNQRGRIWVLNRSKLMELAEGAYGIAEREYDRLIN